MATLESDRELRQIVDLLAVNVEDVVIPTLDRIEATVKDHSDRLDHIDTRLNQVEARIADTLGVSKEMLAIIRDMDTRLSRLEHHFEIQRSD